MPLQSFGIKPVDKQTATITWVYDPNINNGPDVVPDPAPVTCNVIGSDPLPPALWLKFVLDPAAFKSTFDMRVLKSVLIMVQRLRSAHVEPNADYYAGRVLLYIPATSRLIVLAPSQIVVAGAELATIKTMVETVNASFPIATNTIATVELWIEQDSNANISKSVSVTLTNFDVPPYSL